MGVVSNCCEHPKDININLIVLQENIQNTNINSKPKINLTNININTHKNNQCVSDTPKKLVKLKTQEMFETSHIKQFKTNTKKSRRSFTTVGLFIDYKKLQEEKFNNFTKPQLEKFAKGKSFKEEINEQEKSFDEIKQSRIGEKEDESEFLDDNSVLASNNNQQNDVSLISGNSDNSNDGGIKKNNTLFSRRKLKKYSKKSVIKISKEKLNTERIEYIKKFLIEDELITQEMDELTINNIINAFKFLKVKPNYVLISFDKDQDITKKFTKKKTNFSHLSVEAKKYEYTDISDDSPFHNNYRVKYYYILYKGRIEMKLDGDTIILTKDNSITTQALESNTKHLSYLKTIKKSYLFRISLSDYNKIFCEFIDKIYEEKYKFFKTNILFINEDRRILDIILNRLTKKRYIEQTLLVKEGDVLTSFYFIFKGEISIMKENKLIYSLNENNFIGIMNYLYKTKESIFSFYANKDSEIYEINFKTLYSIYDLPLNIKESNFLYNFTIKNADTYIMKRVIKNIFLNAVNNSYIFSKYFNKENIQTFSNIFTLKEYNHNELLCYQLNKKLILPLEGFFTFTSRSSPKNGEANQIVIPNGNFYEEYLFKNSSLNKDFIIKAVHYCLVLEASWGKVIKSTPFFLNNKYTLYDIIKLIKKIDYFGDLSDIKLLYLADNLKLVHFKQNELILKKEDIYDRFFIVVSGTVSLVSNDVEIDTIGKLSYFGKITKKNKNNDNESENNYNEEKYCSFYAKSEIVECYSLDKDIYDEIIAMETLNSIQKNYLHTTIKLNNLYYLKELGQGAYGKVYLVHDKCKLYALKTAEVSSVANNKKAIEGYINEKSVLSIIHHPFIMNLVNTYKTNNFIIFLLEYVQGIPLKTFIEGLDNSSLRNIEIIKFISGILCLALNYLQKRRIIHRDLKPSNLMINQKGYIKLIDFGSAKNLSGKISTSTVIGTPQYMSPEVLTGQQYSWGADVWSCGIILYQIFYGTFPFGISSNNVVSIFNEIQENKPIFPSDHKLEDFNDFINGLLNKNHNKRMNYFYKWKSSKLFQDYNINKLSNQEIESPLLNISNYNKLPSSKNIIQTNNSVNTIGSELIRSIKKNEFGNDPNGWNCSNLFINYINNSISNPFENVNNGNIINTFLNEF